MKRNKIKERRMLPIIILIILFTENAFSFYIDPGTSSYLTQIIIAAAFSVMFYFKHIKNIIKNSIQKNKLLHR